MLNAPAKEPVDGTLRQERSGILGLPLNSEGDEVLAVDGPSNCCTVYVAVPTTSTGRSGDLVVRVNLEAELFGVRRLVAAAFVEPPFRGPAIVVTGMHVDGWHVSMAATRGDTDIRAGIQAARGCSGFRVAVPPGLQCPPGGTDPRLVTGAINPWNPEEGAYRLATSVVDGADFAFTADERVTSISVVASAGAAATIDIDECSGSLSQILVPAGRTFELATGGLIRGPGTITFANFDSWTAQVVR